MRIFSFFFLPFPRGIDLRLGIDPNLTTWPGSKPKNSLVCVLFCFQMGYLIHAVFFFSAFSSSVADVNF